jgi:hypothetical protein
METTRSGGRPGVSAQAMERLAILLESELEELAST